MWFIHFWMTTWQKSPTSGSSIHPRLSEVNGAGRAIAGSKHNSLYHFWQRFTISHKTPEYKKVVRTITLTHIRSTCGTTKCTYAFRVNTIQTESFTNVFRFKRKQKQEYTRISRNHIWLNWNKKVRWIQYPKKWNWKRHISKANAEQWDACAESLRWKHEL